MPQNFNQEKAYAIVRAAKLAGDHYGIPWIILAMQCLHESAGGTAESAPCNVSGMKWLESNWKLPGPPHWTNEYTGTKKATRIQARFCAYFSIEHCVGHMAETLAFSSHYAPFRRALMTEAFDDDLVALAKAYATDIAYAKKIVGWRETAEHIAAQIEKAAAVRRILDNGGRA